MPLYNVRRDVVELVSADSAVDAIRILGSRLLMAGFELYDCGDAFESEPLEPNPTSKEQ